jgi:hypothetical protein
VDRPSHRFLNPSAILTWFIRAAIVWVVSLPLAWRAIQVLERFESPAPPAFVAFFVILAMAKVSLLALLGRALDRVQRKPPVLSGYKTASH